jgi:hypothetical protein
MLDRPGHYRLMALETWLLLRPNISVFRKDKATCDADKK